MNVENILGLEFLGDQMWNLRRLELKLGDLPQNEVIYE
jgi:hypothetical protein